MKKWLVFSLAFTLALPIFGQSKSSKSGYSLKWGETTRTKVLPNNYVGRDKKGNHVFYASRIKTIPLIGVTLIRASDYFGVYDAGFELKENIKIDELPKRKATNFNFHKLGYRDGIMVGSVPYLVEQRKDGKDYQIVGWKLDIDKKRIGKEQNLGKITGVESLRGASISFAFSPDSSKTLLYIPVEYKKSDETGVQVFVFDRDMKKLWAGKCDLPYDDDDFNIQDVSINNGGAISVSGERYIPKKKRSKGDPKWEPVIMRFAEKGKPEKLEINPGGKRVQRFLTGSNTKGQAVAVGFYGNKSFYDQDGLFFARVDDKGDLQDVKTHEFDSDFLTSTMKSKRAARKKEKMDDDDRDESEDYFSFRDLRPMSDGGFLGIAEQYWVVQRTEWQGSGASRRMVVKYYHNYGDLIAARLNADGSLAWTKKLRRMYVIVSYSSMPPYRKMYGFMTKGADSFLIFEDDEKNVDNRDNSKWFDSPDFATVVAKIDPAGNLTRTNVETEDEKDRWGLVYSNLQQIGEGKMMLAAHKGLLRGKKKFGSIEVK